MKEAIENEINVLRKHVFNVSSSTNYNTLHEDFGETEFDSLIRREREEKKKSSTLNVMMLVVLFIVGATCIAVLPSSILKAKEALSEDIQSSSHRKPNVVFILVDDVAWNSIGYEHYDLSFATPHLTSMAMSGIIMENYYSQEVCTPARASLMTGRYPSSIGMQYGEIMPTENLALVLTETLFPEVLRDNGYINYAIGKWNLGHYNPAYLPTSRGFDYFIGYMDGHNYYWSKIAPSATDYYDFMYSNNTCYALYDGEDRYTYSTLLYKEKALDAIKVHDFDSHPMFLYLPLQAAHDPFADYNDTFPGGLDSTYVGGERLKEVEARVVGAKRQQYTMTLMMLDDAVKEIYEEIEVRGQMNNTYFIFASDNGGCYNAGGKDGPLRGTKGSLFEGGTKVDAFIYSPLLGSSSGNAYTGLMHVSDWFSTILSLVGAKFSAKLGFELDSVDHSAALMTLGDSKTNPQSAPFRTARKNLLYNLYYNVQGENFTDINSNAPFAIRNERYKLMHVYTNNKASKWYSFEDLVSDDDNLDAVTSCSQDSACNGDFTKLLFDLIDDPYETTNLYDNPKYSVQRDLLLSQVNVNDVTAEEYYYSTTTAEAYWDENDKFLQPWNFTVFEYSADRASPAPSKCENTGLFSPTYKRR